MAQLSATTSSLVDALARLDEDIAEAEGRLARLRAMRANITPFIEEYVETSPSTEQPTTGVVTSFTDEVLAVFEDRPESVLDVEDVLKFMQDGGVDVTKEKVRNAVNYAAKQGRLYRLPDRRGKFTLKSTSAPAATGADVNENPFRGFSLEIGGGRDEPSTPPHDQDHGADRAPFDLDRVGDRAPIGGSD